MVIFSIRFVFSFFTEHHSRVFLPLKTKRTPSVLSSLFFFHWTPLKSQDWNILHSVLSFFFTEDWNLLRTLIQPPKILHSVSSFFLTEDSELWYSPRNVVPIPLPEKRRPNSAGSCPFIVKELRIGGEKT
jgi:hypothetical protein